MVDQLARTHDQRPDPGADEGAAQERQRTRERERRDTGRDEGRNPAPGHDARDGNGDGRQPLEIVGKADQRPRHRGGGAGHPVPGPDQLQRCVADQREGIADGGRHAVCLGAELLEIADERLADHIAGDRALLAKAAQARDGGAKLGREQLGHTPARGDHGVELIPRQPAERHRLRERVLHRGRALGLGPRDDERVVQRLGEVERLGRGEAEFAQRGRVGQIALDRQIEARIGPPRDGREPVHDGRPLALRPRRKGDPRAEVGPAVGHRDDLAQAEGCRHEPREAAQRDRGKIDLARDRAKPRLPSLADPLQLRPHPPPALGDQPDGNLFGGHGIRVLDSCITS